LFSVLLLQMEVKLQRFNDAAGEMRGSLCRKTGVVDMKITPTPLLILSDRVSCMITQETGCLVILRNAPPLTGKRRAMPRFAPVGRHFI